MSEEEEVTWAKLNGDWTDAKYRRELADKGLCLQTLSQDTNLEVKSSAIAAMVTGLIKSIGHDR